MFEGWTVNHRYRVDRKVGEGGMATVYAGHDLLLDRPIAIKVLHAHYTTDPAFRARFEREAQAAAGFAHPNIVDIFDVGEDGNTPYIVMEFVDGQTLKEVIDQEGPFHPDDVAALLQQVGAALDYAHERGYVHRDVKPQNILVDDHGQAKVVDFGIAVGLSDAYLTDTETGLGTVHYLSPEQASGLMATPASDVYSLGVIAFEMLTGRMPFDADTAVAVAMRHIHDAPPRPSALLENVPPAVDRLVLRALEKDPTRRYASAGAFAQAMTDWRSSSPSTAAAPSRVPTPAAAERKEVIPAPLAASAEVSPVRARAHVAGGPGPRGLSPSGIQESVGCATWAVGSAMLVGLITLIVIGFRLSPHLSDLSSSEENPTMAPTGEPTVLAAAPAADSVSTHPAETATGPTDVAVPDLSGMSQEEAVTAANSRGFQLAVGETVFAEAVEVGRVAEQDPPHGQPLAQGSTIYVKLSRGSARVDLSSLELEGKTSQEATAALADAGVGAVVERVASAEVAEGDVVAIVPETANVGDTVTLRVSVGNKVQVAAALQGRPVDQATAQLQALGLRLMDPVGVDRETIEAQGIDLATLSIEDRDVVGVQGDGVTFDAWVEPGTAVTLVFYDATLDG